MKLPEKYKDFKKIPIQQSFGMTGMSVEEGVKENIVEDLARRCKICGGFISRKQKKCPFCNI